MKKRLIIDKTNKFAKFVDDEKEFCIPIISAKVDTELTNSEIEVTLKFKADIVEIR